jgi:hypothetical protein
MVVLGSGNVGIGNTAPSAKLDVEGKFTVAAGTATFTQTVLNGDGTRININGTSVTGSAYTTWINSGASFVGYFGYDNTAGNNFITGGLNHGYTMATVYNHPLVFGTNSTAKMVVLGSGNVGIGNTAPSTKLHVSTGTFTLDGTGSPAAGGALCFNTAKAMSKCTSAVDASGNCTCP